MIPSAIAGGRLRIGTKETEIRFLELSPDGFTFRLADPLPGYMTPDPQMNRQADSFPALAKTDVEQLQFQLYFLHFFENRFAMVTLESSELQISAAGSEAYGFAFGYRVQTDVPDFQKEALHLLREYMNYITWKLEEDDAELSKKMAGYPAEQEAVISPDFETQKKKWLDEAARRGTRIGIADDMYADAGADTSIGADINADTSVDTDADTDAEKNNCVWKEIQPDFYELGIEIDRPQLYRRFLSMSASEFFQEYWKKNGLEDHPLAAHAVQYLYIGNQVCPHLFPAWNMLQLLLEKTEREGIIPVLTGSWMQESQIKDIELLLEKLDSWCAAHQRKLELVCNDWGMMAMIQRRDSDHFLLTLGMLLQKQRRDPRQYYRVGYDPKLPVWAESSVNADFYRDYLQTHEGIERISVPACGRPVHIPKGKTTLHLPFWQMNTSQFCPLLAVFRNGDRAKQRNNETSDCSCFEVCETQALLYPDMLRMVGRYNSIYGCDETILYDDTLVKDALQQGTDRIVIGLL